ncbi:MAG: ABC transporter permease [Myxococcales bacterium]|jgi:putative ABC transport system permease protein|nr:ABC transporter permease [Myxococcales bacterium]MBL0195879.1 ABC transporter permease [Myxococcales bacterium]HQY64426.1 ABC transporter permease [Polyangiaceae bacterium]
MVPIRYNLRSLAVRKVTTVATALGIGLVVGVLAISMMLSNGIKKTLGASGHDDVAIVLRKGSDNELGSTIEDANVGLLTTPTQVKGAGAGAPAFVAEVVVVTAVEKLGAKGVTNLLVRGVNDDVLAFRPTVTLVEGRAPKPGVDEAIVGQRVRGRFRGMELGQRFDIKKNRPVTVVGVFSDQGSSHESEVWVPLDTLRSSFGREGIRSSVRVRLSSPGAFADYQRAVEQDRRLGLQAMRETTYYEKQSEGTGLFITVIGTLVSVFFSLAAILGAAITMYAAVASRSREVGILRALGFSRFSILVAFVIESMMLSGLGGLVGLGAALALGGQKVSMMNFASGSEVVFTFEPTPGIVLTGVVFSLVMGLLGGFLPALRAARVPPVVAMRG